MLILTIISFALSVISLSGFVYFLIEQHKSKPTIKNILTSTDIDIGKCFVQGDDINSFEIRIYANGKNYSYTVKDGDLTAIKTDAMSKEFKY